MQPAGPALSVLAVCLLLTCSVCQAEPGDDAIDFGAARENPELRYYFSQLFQTPGAAHVWEFRGGAGGGDEVPLEYWQRQLVDSQIDQFVTDIHGRVDALHLHWALLKRMGATPEAYPPERWRSELSAIENEANGLRKSLKPVFPELSEKEFVISPTSVNAREPAAAIELIGQEIAEAHRLISDLLFRPTFIASVEALRRGNMLDFLRRVSVVARAVKDSL